MKPAGISPVVTMRHNATSNLRANATPPLYGGFNEMLWGERRGYGTFGAF